MDVSQQRLNGIDSLKMRILFFHLYYLISTIAGGVVAERKVFICVSDHFTYPELAKALFDEPLHTLNEFTTSSVGDVVVRGETTKCPWLKKFRGIILSMNGEPPLPVPSLGPLSVFIGPYINDMPGRTLQIYNVANWANTLRVHNPEYFNKDGFPNRLYNDGTHFMLYVYGDCISYRDKAFELFDKLTNARFTRALLVHVLGKRLRRLPIKCLLEIIVA